MQDPVASSSVKVSLAEETKTRVYVYVGSTLNVAVNKTHEWGGKESKWAEWDNLSL